MEIKCHFDHFNINVTDLAKSLDFYSRALALRHDEDDFEAVHEYHKANGWVCFENPAMGIYFINDPDDYWIEILPRKRSNS